MLQPHYYLTGFMLPFAPLMMHVSVPVTDTAVLTCTCQLYSLQHALMHQFRATVAGLIMVLSHSNTVTHLQFEVMRVTSKMHAKASDIAPGVCADFLAVPQLNMHSVLSRINTVFRWSTLFKGPKTLAMCDAAVARLQLELTVQLGVEQTFNIQKAASVTDALECSYLWLLLGKLLILRIQF